MQLGKYWVVTNLFQGQPGQTAAYNEGVTHTQTSIAGVPSSTLVRAISTTAGSGTVVTKTEAVTSSSAGTLQIPQTQMLTQAAIGQQLPNGTIITTQAQQQQQQRHVAEHQQQQLHVHGKFSTINL